MASDMIPQSVKNLETWLKLQLAEVADHSSACGATQAETIEFLGHVNGILPLASSIVTVMEQLDQLTSDLEPLKGTHIPGIRKYIKRCKTAPGCTPSIIEALDWKGDTGEIDPETSRPNINLTALTGKIRIDGNKPGFEAVNGYWRRKGDMAWKPLVIRKRKFPIYDENPLLAAGVPEIREYMFRGVVDDEEIGVPSEIKEIVFVG